MRANEYAAKYAATPTNGTLTGIAFAMLLETKELAETRHAQSTEALISILNEQIDKWRSFASKVGDGTINPDGLKMLIAKDFPFIPQHLLK